VVEAEVNTTPCTIHKLLIVKPTMVHTGMNGPTEAAKITKLVMHLTRNGRRTLALTPTDEENDEVVVAAAVL